MRKFGLIIYYEIKNFFHDIKFFILAPLIPVLLMITLFPIESFYKEETSSTKSFTIAVSDETGSDYSGMVISNLENANALKDLDLV